MKVNTIWLLARCTNTGTYRTAMPPPLPASPPESNTMALTPLKQYGGLHCAHKDIADQSIEIVPTNQPIKWHLKMSRPGGDLKEEVEDVVLVLGYEWNEL